MLSTIRARISRILQWTGNVFTIKEAVGFAHFYWGTVWGWLSLAGGFLVAILLEYKFLTALTCGLVLSLLVAHLKQHWIKGESWRSLAQAPIDSSPTPPRPSHFYSVPLDLGGERVEALASALFALDALRGKPVSSDDDVHSMNVAFEDLKTPITDYVRSISITDAYHLTHPGISIVTLNPAAFSEVHNSLLHSIAAFKQSLRMVHLRCETARTSQMPSVPLIAERPNMTLGEAWRYLQAESQWGHRGKSQIEAHDELARGISFGAISSWGRACTNYPTDDGELKESDLRFSDVEEPIATSEWQKTHLQSRSMWGKMPSSHEPHMSYPKEGHATCYGYIRVNRSQLSRQWPPIFASG